ncbi:MAG: Gfo/Idh/MocA family oxidoreductase [Ruminiclostridium sp.]|nr:Gfo/Idh/MocA family oxidoreductase [Ruminiclostridium sp.]
MNGLVKVGVIGAGPIAEAHLASASQIKDIQLVSIADIVEEKAKVLASKYCMKAYTDYKQMLGKESLDIVIINLPHFLHKQAVIDCAEKGCHILLEKPMALNERECDEIIGVCEKQNVKLMLGHIQHFFSANIKIKEIVESGKLGKLLMITNVRYGDYFTSTRPDWFLHYNTAGGGILMNLGAHSIDVVQFLSGSRVKSVRAVVGKFAKGVEVEGNAQVFLTLDSGVTASITLAGYKTVPQNVTELVFTGGMIKVTSADTIFLMDKEGRYKEVILEKSDPFGLQISELIRSINENSDPSITGEYGRSIIRAIKAVYASSDNAVEVTL